VKLSEEKKILEQKKQEDAKQIRWLEKLRSLHQKEVEFLRTQMVPIFAHFHSFHFFYIIFIISASFLRAPPIETQNRIALMLSKLN